MSTNVFSDVLEDRLLSALRSPEAVQELSDSIEATAGSSDLTVTVTLSPSQITNLFTTPVTLIPVPSAGQVIVIKEVYSTYTFVTTAYVGSDSFVRIRYSNSNPIYSFNDLLEQTQNTARISTSFSGASFDSTPVGVTISADDTIPPGGDSVLKIRIKYSIEPFQL